MTIRKTAAVLLLTALCLGLTSCGYNPEIVGTVTSPDGKVTEITCGEYLCAQYEVVYDIVQQAGISDSQQIDMKKLMELEAGDGETIREYVAEAVKETLINRTVTDDLYEKTELAGDVATMIYYDNYIQSDWADTSAYMRANGIGYDSFHDYEMQIIKAGQIPYVLYGKGGEKELSEEYIAEYMEKRVGRYTYLNLPYRNALGTDLSSSDIATLKAFANEILALINETEHAAGVPAKDLIANAANEYTDRYQNLLGYRQEMSSITYENQLLMDGDGTFTQGQYDQMLRVKEGEFALIEGDTGLFSIVYRHPLEESDTADNLINNIITAVAGDMYRQYLAELAEGYTIEFDEKAIKYYSPEKIVM